MNKKQFKFSLTILITLFSYLIIGCGAGKDKTNVELIQDMMDQRSQKSQSEDKYFKRGSVRTPPEHTVPRGFTPYKYAYDPIAAETNLKNPLASSPDVLARGKVVYNTYCAVCHGVQGKGDGTISQYISAIPDLTTEKVVNFKDGRIYHIITDGQGRMMTYATQITNPNDRWAAVHYVRSLQKGN